MNVLISNFFYFTMHRQIFVDRSLIFPLLSFFVISFPN